MVFEVDYHQIALKLISAPRPPSPKALPSISTSTRLDFDAEPAQGEDELQPGFFLPGTFVSHLAAKGVEEKGEYNVLLDPRNPDVFLLSTNGYHPQSAPLRPSYLIHTYRLLLAVEDALNASSQVEERKNVVAIYDCGEDSGAVVGHKCIRFYTVPAEPLSNPELPHQSRRFPEGLTYTTPTKEIFQIFQDLLENFIPTKPSYNLIATKDQCLVVPREKGSNGILESKGEGRWDGARLLGIGA